MFNIEYTINPASFADLEIFTEEDIRYRFLQGSVCFYTDSERLEMKWDWIPILDFSFCLSNIVASLSYKNEAKECFEFTESAEVINFFKERSLLKIVPSFSEDVLNASFDDFAKGVRIFHLSVSKYIKENVFYEVPSILNKYISTDD